MEASGLEQGDEAEVLEGAEASGRALGELEEAVDSLYQTVGDAGGHPLDSAKSHRLSHDAARNLSYNL